MLTGSSTEAISKGYVAILAKEPCEFGKDFRWDRKIRMAQSYAEKSMLCYIEIWVSCAVMLLFLENIYEARGGLFARSVRHCRCRRGSGLAAKANVTARKAAFNNKAHILPARTTDIQTTHDKSLYRGC